MSRHRDVTMVYLPLNCMGKVWDIKVLCTSRGICSAQTLLHHHRIRLAMEVFGYIRGQIFVFSSGIHNCLNGFNSQLFSPGNTILLGALFLLFSLGLSSSTYAFRKRMPPGPPRHLKLLFLRHASSGLPLWKQYAVLQKQYGERVEGTHATLIVDSHTPRHRIGCLLVSRTHSSHWSVYMLKLPNTL